MKPTTVLSAVLTSLIHDTAAAPAASNSSSTTASVFGAAEGFAKGVTGGGNATPLYPADTQELVKLLGSTDPQVIVLNKTYDFRGTEGTATETGCAPWGTTDAACQQAINANDWCSSSYPSVEVTYDNAGLAGITVASNKTLVGEGSAGVIRGKGLRIVNGASNVIVQNVDIADLNPQYVWGGDAFVLSGTDLVWIDHCTTSSIGRQHYAFGFDANKRITLSNNFINGKTNFSASCNGHHYWTLELVGEDDQITFKSRGPALSGNTLFHAINSVWEDVAGHAIEGDKNGQGLFEGCVFDNVTQVVVDDFSGQLFSAPDASANAGCEAALGRACESNVYTDSGAFDRKDTGFFANFTGLNVAGVVAAAEARGVVVASAGAGKL